MKTLVEEMNERIMGAEEVIARIQKELQEDIVKIMNNSYYFSEELRQKDIAEKIARATKEICHEQERIDFAKAEIERNK